MLEQRNPRLTISADWGVGTGHVGSIRRIYPLGLTNYKIFQVAGGYTMGYISASTGMPVSRAAACNVFRIQQSIRVSPKYTSPLSATANPGGGEL